MLKGGGVLVVCSQASPDSEAGAFIMQVLLNPRPISNTNDNNNNVLADNTPFIHAQSHRSMRAHTYVSTYGGIARLRIPSHACMRMPAHL